MLALLICNIKQITAHTRIYELRATNEEELPLIAAGAHVNIHIETQNGTTIIKQFSICSDPSQRDKYEILIEYTQENHIHANVAYNSFQVGSTLHCDTLGNTFQLHADTSPALFITDGIGIAAIKPMAQTLARRGRRFQLHYAGSSLNEMVFDDYLKNEFNKNYFPYPANENKFLDVMSLLEKSAHNTVIYISGSRALIDATYSAANTLGISKDRIHSESFALQKNQDDKSVIVELVRSNKLIHVNANESLLAVIRNAGVIADFDCCIGECGTCAVKIIEGEADHRDTVLSDAAHAEGMICICVSRARSEKLILDL